MLKSCLILGLACACSSSAASPDSPSQPGAPGGSNGLAGGTSTGSSAAGDGTAGSADSNHGGNIGSGGEPSAAGSGGSGGEPAALGGNGGSVAGVAGNSGDSGKAGSAGSGGSANTEPAIHWIGRVARTASGARFSWPGTGFSARFNGTGASASLKTSNMDYLQLIVDGQVSLLTTQSGSHIYTLARGLVSGEHTLTLWRRTEPNHGTIEAGPITFDGSLLAPPVPATHRLEVIGDSLTVGFGLECKTNAEPFSYATENNYLTYQALAARKFSAELSTLAWSGLGVWRNVGGDFIQPIPVRYLRTIPNEDTTSTWDFSSYTPDAVLINLGKIDFAKGDPGQPFVDAYQAFVVDLRKHYAKARLYLAVSPMLSGAQIAQEKAYLVTVKSARAAAGDNNIALIEFARPPIDEWGCGHPTGTAHAVMATLFEQALTTDLGW